ncbi:MAG: hypothetical protein ACLP7P_01515 [Rhodomicrobium sp.]
MRREGIIKAADNVREALHAAQIRELLRAARTGQPTGDENSTPRILGAYHEFMRHYHQFGEEEKGLIEFLGLSPLLDIGFWCTLIDVRQEVDRKLLSDLEVAAYNVIFVMPGLRELLARETDKEEFITTDVRGNERAVSCLRVLVAEKERSLTDPSTIITVIRSMDKLYKALSVLHGERSVGLAIGSIDSGSAKSFDFFGASPVMEEIGALLVNVWDKIKYCAEENFRYQIEVAMIAIGFVMRAKKAQAQSLVSEEQAQRVTRIVASSIEILFRSGAYTLEMDAPREARASKILTPKGRTIEFKEGGADIEAEPSDARIEQATWLPGPSIAGPAPSISGILSSLRDGAGLESAVES